jgi:hypothetical protein
VIATLKRQPFTVIFAVLLGLVVAPMITIGTHGILGLYDSAFPVVTMQGELVKADANEVVIRISGVKHRPCTYLRVQALGRDLYGNLSDANMQRADSIENGDTKAPGKYFIGEWRIWPRGEAVAVIVNSNHLCGNRLVITKIAEVVL